MSEEKKPLSRSEREAKIKDKAGWVITVLAALLAVNTYVASGFSSKVLNNTIAAITHIHSISQNLSSRVLQNKVMKKHYV